MAAQGDGPEDARPAAGPWAWGVLAVALLAVALLRYRLAGIGLERDEGEYAYMGQLLLQGVPPYQDAYNMKFPGTYAAYAVVLALFGETPWGIHVGLACVNMATSVLLFLLARRFLAAPWAVAAAIAYAWMSTSTAVLGPMAHATQFQMLFVVGGLLLADAREAKRSPGRYLAAGVMLGLGVLVKQPGAVFVLPALGLLLKEAPGAAPRDGVTRGVHAAWLLFGVFAPLAVTGGLLYAAGVFPKFWFWTVDYARAYASVTTLASGLNRLQMIFWTLMDHLGGLVAIAFIGLALLPGSRTSARARLFLASFTLCGAIATSAGLWFRPHYFVTLLPALALLIGFALAEAHRIGARLRVRWDVILALIYVFGLGQVVWVDRTLLSAPLPAISRGMYTYFAGFPEAQLVGAYLRDACPGRERILVYGSEPEIFFYAQRRAATGYLYMYPLDEHQIYAKRMEKEFEQEAEASAAAYMVVMRTLGDDFPDPATAARRAWLARLMRCYEPVAYVVQSADRFSPLVRLKPGTRPPERMPCGILVLKRSCPPPDRK